MRTFPPKLRYWLAVAVLAVAAMAIAAAVTEGPGILSAQTAEPSVMEQTDTASATEVEIQRRFNDLRSELLDDRSDTVEWWLAATAIFVTLFGVGAVLLGYLAYNRFREVEAEARESAETVRKAADQATRDAAKTRQNLEQSEALIGGATSKDISDPDKAEKIGEAVQEVRSDRAASPLALGIADAYVLQQEGKSEEAAEKWRAIATLIQGIDDSLAARAWLSVGYLLKEGKHREALEASAEEVLDAYNNAIGLRPDYADAYNDRGVLKGALGQYENAIADLNQAIQLDPGSAEPYVNRGMAKDALGRHEDAIADFDQALSLNPDLAEAYNNRGAAKRGLDRNEDAIADLGHAIRLNPTYAEAYVNRGGAKIALGRYKDAIADCEEAIRLNPNLGEPYGNRGAARVALGDIVGARSDYETALNLAQRVGNDRLAADIEQRLQALDDA